MGRKEPGSRVVGGEDLQPLTIIRIFAALWVVCSHQCVYWHWLASPSLEPLRRVFKHGDTGVKVFFVLSGFILTHVYAGRDTVRKKAFFTARFARIYPLYVAALVVALPALWLYQIPADLHQYGSPRGWIMILVKSASVLLLVQAWIPGFASHWNGVSWSLSAEAFFYTAFPFAMPRIKRLSILGMGILFAVILALEVFRQGRFDAGGTHEMASFWMCNPLLRLPDFLTGVLVGILRLRGAQMPRAMAFPAVLLLLAGSAMPDGFGVVRTLAIHLACAGLISSLAFPIPDCGLLAKSGILLGQSSYATYLVHQSLGFVFFAVTTRILGSEPPYLSYLAVLILVSVALFKFVESPARDVIRRWGRDS